MNDFNGFGDLDNFDEEMKKPAKDNTVKFPCVACGGTGNYQQVRVHQEKSHCFSCRGKGYHKTDPRKRAAAKDRRLKRKAQTQVDNLSDFREGHADLVSFLEECQGCSRYCSS